MEQQSHPETPEIFELPQVSIEGLIVCLQTADSFEQEAKQADEKMFTFDQNSRERDHYNKIANTNRQYAGAILSTLDRLFPGGEYKNIPIPEKKSL